VTFGPICLSSRADNRLMVRRLADPNVHRAPATGTQMPATGASRRVPGSRRTVSALWAVPATGLLLLAVCAPASASVRPAPAVKTGPVTTRARIIADWDAFFSFSTPVSRKVALLQNGESYAKLVASETSSPITTGLAAEVATVTLTSTTTATVIYSLTIGGKPALAKLRGEAVLQSGTWKVGDRSFCSLISLEGVSTPGCPGPSAGA
jgi:hypothetical protein